MSASLVMASLLMGLAGSPHCAAMCGAGCAVVSGNQRGLWSFQAGRMAGYAAAGALMATSAAALQWGWNATSVLKPFWAMLHVAIVVLGLWLACTGRQPAWLDRLSQRVWQRLRHRTLGWEFSRLPRELRAAGAGVLWVLLPCGLLYSALMVAALASTPVQGAGVMAAFALGSALGLHLGPTLWWRFARPGGAPAARAQAGQWAIRLAGLTLALASGWALWHGVWMAFLAPVCQ